MKLLTLNFLQCPSKPCKADPISAAKAFPLQPVQCELVRDDAIPFNGELLRGLLGGRVEWEPLTRVAGELGFNLPTSAPPATAIALALDDTSHSAADLPATIPDDTIMADATTPSMDTMDTTAAPPADPEPPTEPDMEMTRKLWEVLIETRIEEGTLRCRGCGHEYKVKEGIGGFLLPAHLV